MRPFGNACRRDARGADVEERARFVAIWRKSLLIDGIASETVAPESRYSLVRKSPASLPGLSLEAVDAASLLAWRRLEPRSETHLTSIFCVSVVSFFGR
jgi:hypothetical protein